jgi:hypothetical protein
MPRAHPRPGGVKRSVTSACVNMPRRSTYASRAVAIEAVTGHEVITRRDRVAHHGRAGEMIVEPALSDSAWLAIAFDS